MTPLNEEWWAAAREGRLVVQRCDACGHHQHHPRPFCLSCRRTDGLSFVEATGRGVVHSFTTVHRSPKPELEPGYTVALVDLEEGVRLVSWLIDCDEPRCDLPVEVAFRDGLPVFRPTA